MKYIILALILLSSAALADTPVANDTKNPVSMAAAVAASDDSYHGSSLAQVNTIPVVRQTAAVPSEFLSAPQYQPQPLPQFQASPLYSLSSP
jgi:hypothetical protein